MLSRIYRSELEIRKRQIDTLKVFNDNVTEVKEGSEYQIQFQSGGHNLVLIVILTKDFPNEKPILKVSPLIIHPWVNNEGEVLSAPGLLNFTVYSDLGRVVQAIIREFERTPPPLVSEQRINNPTSPTGSKRDSDNMGRISPNYPSNYLNRHGFSPPQATGVFQTFTFPELNTYSLEDLEFLNESEERRGEFLENLQQTHDMNKTLDDMISLVEELADLNLSKEKQLEELQKDIELRIQEITKLAFENERLNITFQNLSDKYSPENIKDQLKLAAESSEVESEKIADVFLKGGIDVDKFVNLYIQSRTLTQTRKTKEEKLSQQLQSLKKAGF
ncbi:williams-beuren syndrome critical region protein-related [Holotrichia oblita]|uniref:Williams-beuren syndrome critical region protein-related n=1 Tax=Holotrichia oblita TaxID=644536 RepID=A0ACB9TED0_HOLOL|nr:williams-beuren syndrome critical region protein-related [Holotrichia oblita]